jgi:hypothetical protein
MLRPFRVSRAGSRRSRSGWHVRYASNSDPNRCVVTKRCNVPKADIWDDVNEKERPPRGGLSKAVRDVRYAALDF